LAADFAAVLSRAREDRGKLPARIRVDNGIELTSRALDYWAYWSGADLGFSRTGKPADNAFIEAYNGTLRRECLSQHWFAVLGDAQRALGAWREDHNNTRLHRSVANPSPAKYRRGSRDYGSIRVLEPEKQSIRMDQLMAQVQHRLGNSRT